MFVIFLIIPRGSDQNKTTKVIQKLQELRLQKMEVTAMYRKTQFKNRLLYNADKQQLKLTY